MKELRESIKKSLLSHPVCTVVFEKADGTERKMYCTINKAVLDEHVPKKEYDHTELKPAPRRVKNENIMTVWDLEANAWRSFNVEKVISFEEGRK